jgi:hypothetical protein
LMIDHAILSALPWVMSLCRWSIIFGNKEIQPSARTCNAPGVATLLKWMQNACSVGPLESEQSNSEQRRINMVQT